MKYIGLSLSLCVRDIAACERQLNEVAKIISGTSARTPEDWDQLINYYKERDWKEFPELAKIIVRQLLASDKIEQPYLTQNRTPNRATTGSWVEDESQIEWNEFDD